MTAPLPLWPTTLLLVGAGLVSAVQVGKAPAALHAVQAVLGLSLGVSAWLLSAFGIVGAVFGFALGAVSDRLGARRTLVAGLLVQGLAAAGGATAERAALLLASRLLEGVGFLAVIVAAPALIGRVAAGRPAAGPFAAWSTFMPAGMALVLLASPWLLAHGWRVLWWASSVLALAYAVLVAWRVPADAARISLPRGGGATLRQTFFARGPIALLLIFMLYAAAWFALFGLLPAVLQGGIAANASRANLLTALAVGAGAAGNVAGGVLLARGRPPASLVAVALAFSAVLALVASSDAPGPWTRYGTLVLFAAISGVVPPALFAQAPAQAPHPGTLGVVAGMMMQGNSLGLVLGPAIGAALASAGGLPALGAGVAVAAGAALAVALWMLPRARR